jgi:hypothetical protein
MERSEGESSEMKRMQSVFQKKKNKEKEKGWWRRIEIGGRRER